MKYCPNCGAPVEEGHKFCAACGAKLTVPEMPKEPVYTDDPALLNDPVLQPTPAPEAPDTSGEKVPELTLEPDLWGMPPASKPVDLKKPGEAKAPELTLDPQPLGTPQAAKPAEPAAPAAAAAAAQAPSYAAVMEGVEYENDLRKQQEETRRRQEEKRRLLEEESRKREEARRLWEEEQRRRAAQAAQDPAPDNVPLDYTMSQSAPEEEKLPQLPDETLLLIWSIVLTCMCNIPGIVGLVKTLKARKAFTLAQKMKLLSSAKIWLIIGTALYAMTFLGNLF